MVDDHWCIKGVTIYSDGSTADANGIVLEFRCHEQGRLKVEHL